MKSRKQEGEKLAGSLYMSGKIDVAKYAAAMRIFDRGLDFEIKKTINKLEKIKH